MGGGGFVSAPGFGRGTNINRLQDVARQELKKPVPEPRKKVFISFRSEDKPLVDLFRCQAKNKNNDLDFIDFSLRVPFNSKNAEYIKRGIRERIRQSSVTVVLITESTHKSKWVDWEIRESKKLGKGVVGVKCESGSSPKIPKAISEHGCEVVNWNHNEIRRAINRAEKNR